MGHEQMIKCQWCGKSLTKIQIARHQNYCSRSCSVSHRNTTPAGRKRNEWHRQRISEVTSGEKNPMYGRSHSEKTKQHWSEIRTGRPQPQSAIEKWKDGRRTGVNAPNRGRDPWNKGKKDVYSKETLEMMGQSAKDHMKNIGRNKWTPAFNPKACEYFEKFDTANNTSGQYAKHDREFSFFSEKLNKFIYLDYINHDSKLIIEWYERGHKNKKKMLEDRKREKAIRNHFVDYTFTIIRDY
jgi:NUMOD3 motif